MVSSEATFTATSAADEAAGVSTPRSSIFASETVVPMPLTPSCVTGLPSAAFSSALLPAAPSTSA